MNSITKKFYLDIGISTGMKVLDVGCGQGVTTELITEIVGKNGKVIGIDSNRNALNQAEQNANLNKLKNINYICADLSKLDIKNNKFDAIVGRRILKYLPNPKIFNRTTFETSKTKWSYGVSETRFYSSN